MSNSHANAAAAAEAAEFRHSEPMKLPAQKEKTADNAAKNVLCGRPAAVMRDGETIETAAAMNEKFSAATIKTAYLPAQSKLLTSVFLRIVKIHLSFIIPDMSAAFCRKIFAEVGMPELPEVETIKNAIQKGIGYANIINVSVNDNRFRQIIPQDFAIKITGARISSYQRIGKYIVIGLNNNLSIIWHLGMSGRVKISEQRPEILEKHDHVVIETDNGTLIYNDARRFGLMTYCQTSQLLQNHLFSHTGIDPFDRTLTGSYLQEKLKNKKMPIKIALLDQQIISGIGNIYASEALYGAKILPTRPAGSLDIKECGVLVDEIRNVLNKAIKAGGSTLRDYRKPDGSLGYFQNEHCVYNKAGQPCPHCTCSQKNGEGIRKITQAGRSTYYCPIQQK